MGQQSAQVSRVTSQMLTENVENPEVVEKVKNIKV